MLEDATLENLSLGLSARCEKLPLGAPRKEGFDPVSRAPIKIVVRVVAVAQLRRDGNNPLVLVVS